MKIIKQGTSLLKNADGKLLKVRPDEYIYPDPDVFIFTIETTNVNEVFTLPLFDGSGYLFNFVVDWGDSSTGIVNSFADVDKQHTFGAIGSYTIRISAGSGTTGVCHGFRFRNIGIEKNMITRVISWGIANFKELDFYGCRALISLPEQTNKLTGLLYFTDLFRDCSALKEIPYGIFFGNTTVSLANNIFENCSALRLLRADLFQGNTAITQLSRAFYGCTGLTGVTALPGRLFYDLKNITTLSNAFNLCTNLTYVPYNIFERDSSLGTPAAVDIDYIFAYCARLPEIKPNTFDFIKVKNMSGSFYACTLLTTFAEGEFANQENINNLNSTFRLSGITVVPKDFFKNSTTAVVVANISAQYCFANCLSLTTVNESAFEGCTKIQSFDRVFMSSTALDTIGINVFKNCPAALYFTYSFYTCPILNGVPSDLFNTNNSNPNVINSISYCFQGHRLPTLPATLLQYCTALVSMEYAFYGNTATNLEIASQITTIPSGFLNSCTSLQNISYVFGYLRNLKDITVDLVEVKAIPYNLFYNNISLTNLTGVFYYCQSLQSIPDYLFRNNTAATIFSATFGYCAALASIPVNLFHGLTDDSNNIIQVDNLFVSCTGLINTSLSEVIPPDLFRWSNKITNMQQLFMGCTGIQYINPDMYKYNPLVSVMSYLYSGCTALLAIPATLFDTNDGASNAIANLSFAFNGCIALTSVPSGLLDLCLNLSNVGQMFQSCTYLTTIPDGLFALNSSISGTGNIGGFYATFYNCTRLTINPWVFYTVGNRDTRFYNKNVTFNQCFQRASWTDVTGDGTAPDVWAADFGGGVITKSQCFAGAGNSADSITNYASIPVEWGRVP